VKQGIDRRVGEVGVTGADEHFGRALAELRVNSL
jgi:hypothetical protein